MRKLTWSQFAARIHHALTDEGVAIGPLQTALVAEVVLNELWSAVQTATQSTTPSAPSPLPTRSRRYKYQAPTFRQRTGPSDQTHT